MNDDWEEGLEGADLRVADCLLRYSNILSDGYSYYTGKDDFQTLVKLIVKAAFENDLTKKDFA